jgi:hypothetical protein
MDCDDYSQKDRFKKQIEFMDNNLEIGISGTWFELMNTREIISQPVDPEDTKSKLFLNTSLAHPSVIMRNSVIKDNNLRYNLEYIHGEDYELWVRASRLTKIANIPEVLLSYRVHDSQITRAFPGDNRSASDKVRLSNLQELMGDLDGATKEKHLMILVHKKLFRGLRETSGWIRTLIEKNSEKKIYSSFFDKMLVEIWLEIIQNYKKIGLKSLIIYITNGFYMYDRRSLIQKIFFLIRNIIGKN